MLDSADGRGKEAALRGEELDCLEWQNYPAAGLVMCRQVVSHTSCLHLASLHHRAMHGIRRGNAPGLACLCTNPKRISHAGILASDSTVIGALPRS